MYLYISWKLYKWHKHGAPQDTHFEPVRFGPFLVLPNQPP